MDRGAFEARFAEATDRCVASAAKFLVEALPADRVFRVRLNSSYDGNPPRPGGLVYPEDGSEALAFALRSVDADTVVDTLWRDGAVPEWINLAVVDETGDRTVVEVVAAGRFTADGRSSYGPNPDLAPFHPVGPTLPPGGERRFSVHHRAECWTRADVDRLATFAGEVVFLDLVTADLDAAVVAGLPTLPALAVVEHRACAFGPDALAPFARMPALRTLRVRVARGAAFSVAGDATCPQVRSLSLTDLPPTPWGFEQVPRRVPNLTDLTLAAEVLHLDGSFGSGLDRVGITAGRVVGRAVVPAGLEFTSTMRPVSAPLVISGADHLQPGVAGGGPGELADVDARP
ncbi:hypothetical protein ACFFQW_41690 [Umezawaea endophytica]|uniref:Uncharacterized protein n=1 Tax=Umezawaea endophytica TaxID=1654476 RepID=A0A9X3AGM5_9PSEU|nr:hypothetical protein [Umezawaea endophytica]MCS7480302.1 hypothetical protein [Umezawaea endophytica]